MGAEKTTGKIQSVIDAQANDSLADIRSYAEVLADVASKIFRPEISDEKPTVNVLRKIETNTSRLLGSIPWPDQGATKHIKEQARPSSARMSQAANPQREIEEQPIVNRLVSIHREKPAGIASVFEQPDSPAPSNRPISISRSNESSKPTESSAAALEGQRQAEAAEELSTSISGSIAQVFAKVWAASGAIKHGSTNAIGSVDTDFLTALTGPIGSVYREAKSITNDVGETFGGLKKSTLGAIDWYKGKTGGAELKTATKIENSWQKKEGEAPRDEKGRFLKKGGFVSNKSEIKHQDKIAKVQTKRDLKNLSVLAGVKAGVDEGIKYDDAAQKNAVVLNKEIEQLGKVGGGVGDGEGGGILSGIMDMMGSGKNGKGIVGMLTGGLGMSGLLTASVGTIATGGAGILAGITGAVLVGLAGAGGAIVGKIIDASITKSLGGKSLGEWLFDKFHQDENENKTAESESVNQDYGQLGSVSAKYESGSGGAGTISTGQGDKGGKSYGTYQLASNTETLNNFLKTSGYGSQFTGLVPGSAAFDQKWKAIAQNDPEFGRAQHKYIEDTHYKPAVSELKKAGLDVDGRSRGVQEAVWSKANQYGATGGATLIKNAFKGKDIASLSDSDVIKTLSAYEQSRVTENFKGSPRLLGGLVKRMRDEEAQNLQLTGPNSKVAYGTIAKPAPSEPQKLEPTLVPGTVHGPEVIKPQRIEKTAQQAQMDETNAAIAQMIKNISPVQANPSSNTSVQSGRDKASEKSSDPIDAGVNQVPAEFDDVTLTCIRLDIF